jgi:hypothetical protein
MCGAAAAHKRTRASVVNPCCANVAVVRKLQGRRNGCYNVQEWPCAFVRKNTFRATSSTALYFDGVATLATVLQQKLQSSPRTSWKTSTFIKTRACSAVVVVGCDPHKRRLLDTIVSRLRQLSAAPFPSSVPARGGVTVTIAFHSGSPPRDLMSGRPLMSALSPPRAAVTVFSASSCELCSMSLGRHLGMYSCVKNATVVSASCSVHTERTPGTGAYRGLACLGATRAMARHKHRVRVCSVWSASLPFSELHKNVPYSDVCTA